MRIIILDPKAILPAHQTSGAAGMDLHAITEHPIDIYPGNVELIHTGIAIHIDNPNVAALIVPRSGLATKQKLTVINSPGLIDSDYQGELKVALINHSLSPKTVNNGDRIAQLIFIQLHQVQWEIVDQFCNITSRGSGGFGHTGS